MYLSRVICHKNSPLVPIHNRFCVLQRRNTLYTKRCQNDLKSNEILQLPSGCTPIYHQQFKWILRNDSWTTTCSILSYSTAPDSAASAAAGLASAGFGATFCGSFSSESSSPSQNCCKIQCIQNCQFRRPGEELVYGIQFPIPKQQHFGFIAQTLWDSKILRGHLDAATGVICFSVKTPHTPQDKGYLRSM